MASAGMATAFGLAGRALGAEGRVGISLAQANDGLVPAIVITELLGKVFAGARLHPWQFQ
jgi:hypothetical protein